MSRTGQTAMAVKILRPSMVHRKAQSILHMSDVPPRSRLYGLVPREGRTVWGESLSSYLNRLGWRHGVSPRALSIQEIVPQLSNGYPHSDFATFSRGIAMAINGNGDVALEWSSILERLTKRSDLHLLTLRAWVGDLSSRGQLGEKPCWCPTCYTEWRERNVPLYQPLMWMFGVVTICLWHKRRLQDRCPHCQKHQSIIALATLPGHCTQCNTWLGADLDSLQEQKVDDETLQWQEWVISTLEELRVANALTGALSWKRFFASVERCINERGGCSKLTELTGIPRTSFYLWLGRMQNSGNYTPSLEMILEFCYNCGMSPLHIMADTSSLVQFVQSETHPQRLRFHRFERESVDRNRCLQFILAVLDGREEPLGASQVAERLGYSQRALLRYFPQECILLTKQAQEYRKQRRQLYVERVCEEVRRAVMTLHAQGIFPSHRRLRAMLPRGMMHMPEANVAWHAARCELGLE
jgi:TniQ